MAPIAACGLLKVQWRGGVGERDRGIALGGAEDHALFVSARQGS